MSLSDRDTDQFKPMALESLEIFDKERLSRKEDADPDFDRFKMLFEKPEFDEKESCKFKAMYEPEKEQEEIFFKPLIEKKENPLKKEAADKEINGREPDLPSETEEPAAPVETPEEKGYREGFERGLEKGSAQGQKQGYEDGFKKGESQGFEQGERLGNETGHQQGFEQGLKAGEAKGEKETREKAVEILGSLEASLKTADQTLDLLVEKYEERIIFLIQRIAQKAVMAQLEINDEIVRHLILDALKTLVNPEEVVLRVSLEDYEYIEMIKDEFFDQIDSLSSVSIRSDAGIKRGGCKIETRTASVSADVEARLEAIFDAVKAAGAV